jgi:hypothetical protein
MASAPTYTPIATVTASGGSTSQVVMTSIPQTYTDLVLIINGAKESGGSGGNLWFQYSGDTNGAHYSATRVLGDGTSASSARSVAPTYMMLGDVNSGDRFVSVINIQNYSNTTTYKTSLSQTSSNNLVGAYAGLWQSTSAVTSITANFNGGNFASGSTFTLYGILAA